MSLWRRELVWRHPCDVVNSHMTDDTNVSYVTTRIVIYNICTSSMWRRELIAIIYMGDINVTRWHAMTCSYCGVRWRRPDRASSGSPCTAPGRLRWAPGRRTCRRSSGRAPCRSSGTDPRPIHRACHRGWTTPATSERPPVTTGEDLQW